MDFIDQVKQFAALVEKRKSTLQTEEATKTGIIMPFFSMLGYDVFNPDEFCPEFSCPFGSKKDKRIDYAIMNDEKPIILIEAKHLSEQLEPHRGQIAEYFAASLSKFGILTNGITYKFYTDLEKPNIMDEKPFFEFDITDIRDTQVAELKKFTKSSFNLDNIMNTASELKYAQEFKNTFAEQLQSPTDEFTKLFLSSAHTGLKTQNVIDRFKPVLKRTLNQYINELMNDKIKAALEGQEPANAQPTVESSPVTETKEHKITTTHDEMEAFFIVKNMLRSEVPLQDITYKDNEAYLSILYKNNTRKWICRLYLLPKNSYMIVPTSGNRSKDARNEWEKINLADIYDIENYRDKLTASLKGLTDTI